MKGVVQPARIKETGGLDVFIHECTRSFMERVARACLRNSRASAKPRLARSFIPSERADPPMNRRYLKDECNGSRVPVGPSPFGIFADVPKYLFFTAASRRSDDLLARSKVSDNRRQLGEP